MFVMQVNKSACSKCYSCISICANSNVLVQDTEGYPKYENIHKCISCGHCIAICPNNALSVINVDTSDQEGYMAKGMPLSPVEIESEALFQAICGIRSDRFYEAKEVEEFKIRKIIDAMVLSPSAGNEQNRSYHVFSDAGTIRAMETDLDKENEKTKKIVNNPLIKMGLKNALEKNCRVAYEKYNRIPSTGEIERKVEDTIRELTLKRDDFFLKKAPVLIFAKSDISKKGMHKDFYKSDVEIALTYGTIIAHSLGLSSCRLGLAEIMINRSKALREKYFVGKNERINGILAVGYSNTKWYRIPPRGPAKVTYN